MKNAIVLAGGAGKRMKSDKIKILHNILDKPVISYLTDTLKKLELSNIGIVVGYQKEEVMKTLGDEFDYFVQEKQLGTANAVSVAIDYKNLTGETLILVGDCPLIKAETLSRLISQNKDYDMTVLTADEYSLNSYGKIVRDKFGKVLKIVEAIDAVGIEKSITEINVGIYCIKNQQLFKFLPYIGCNNAKGEYYFTDIVEILSNNKGKINTIKCNRDNNEFLGINEKKDLVLATGVVSMQINENHILNGVTIINPSSTYIGSGVEIENDVIIYPNTYIFGNSKLKKSTQILSGCRIENSIIGENNIIENSKIVESEIADNCVIGPFANIRPKSVIKSNCKIGNFVEVKNSVVGNGVKVSHQSYIGDCEIGDNSNIGAGVKIANFDGTKKHHTVIEDNVFIGCNSVLVSPVKISSHATIAAGSVIVSDVDENALAIARAFQVNKSNYKPKK